MLSGALPCIGAIDSEQDKTASTKIPNIPLSPKLSIDLFSSFLKTLLMPQGSAQPSLSDQDVWSWNRGDIIRYVEYRKTVPPIMPNIHTPEHISNVVDQLLLKLLRKNGPMEVFLFLPKQRDLKGADRLVEFKVPFFKSRTLIPINDPFTALGWLASLTDVSSRKQPDDYYLTRLAAYSKLCVTLGLEMKKRSAAQLHRSNKSTYTGPAVTAILYTQIDGLYVVAFGASVATATGEQKNMQTDRRGLAVESGIPNIASSRKDVRLYAAAQKLGSCAETLIGMSLYDPQVHQYVWGTAINNVLAQKEGSLLATRDTPPPTPPHPELILLWKGLCFNCEAFYTQAGFTFADIIGRTVFGTNPSKFPLAAGWTQERIRCNGCGNDVNQPEGKCSECSECRMLFCNPDCKLRPNSHMQHCSQNIPLMPMAGPSTFNVNYPPGSYPPFEPYYRQ